jgi:hypothetical protein
MWNERRPLEHTRILCPASLTSILGVGFRNWAGF